MMVCSRWYVTEPFVDSRPWTWPIFQVLYARETSFRICRLPQSDKPRCLSFVFPVSQVCDIAYASLKQTEVSRNLTTCEVSSSSSLGKLWTARRCWKKSVERIYIYIYYIYGVRGFMFMMYVQVYCIWLHDLFIIWFWSTLARSHLLKS